MAGNQPPEGYATDDFLEQILAIPSYSTLPPVNEVGGGGGGSSSDTASLTSAVSQLSSAGGGGALHHQSQLFPLGLSLDNGRDDVSDTGAAFGLKPVSFFFFFLYNSVHFFSLFEPSMEFFALFKRKLESNSEFFPLFSLQDRESINMGSLYPAFEQLQPHGIRHAAPQAQQVEHVT